DGASNTAAISERLIGDFQNTIATHETDTFNPGTFPTSAGLPDGSLPGASADCGALDSSANWTNTTFQGFSDSGQAWLTGWHSITLYDHTMAPNTISCVFVSPADAAGNKYFRWSTSASSAHPGGVNVAFCDGSVRFISQNIDLATWRGIGSTNGSERLSPLE